MWSTEAPPPARSHPTIGNKNPNKAPPSVHLKMNDPRRSTVCTASAGASHCLDEPRAVRCSLDREPSRFPRDPDQPHDLRRPPGSGRIDREARYQRFDVVSRSSGDRFAGTGLHRFEQVGDPVTDLGELVGSHPACSP